VSDQRGYYAPPAAGYGLYMLGRFLWQAANNAGPTLRPAPAPPRAPIITPPPKPAASRTTDGFFVKLSYLFRA